MNVVSLSREITQQQEFGPRRRCFCRAFHVPYKVTMTPFPAGLPFATQTASFRSRIKSSTLDIVSRCHRPSDPAAITRNTCVPCKRYEVLADSAEHSDATPSSTFCPQLLECSNSVCESRTPLQKLLVRLEHITQEKSYGWPLEWLLPRQQCPDRMRCTP